MNKFHKESFYKIFIFLFTIVYTFLPPIGAINSLLAQTEDYNIKTYSDNTYTNEESLFYTGETIYLKATSVTSQRLQLSILDSEGIRTTLNNVNNQTEITNSYTIPSDGSAGKWTAQLEAKGHQNDPWEIQSFTTFTVEVLSSDFEKSGVQTIHGRCIENAYGSKLNCTANDIVIANVTNIQVEGEGCRFPGDEVTFTANWNVQSNASQRYNIGLYFPTGGQNNALNGNCSVTTLPNHPYPDFYNFDNNKCGDVASGSLVSPTITLTVTCLDEDENNKLDLPYCTSWHQNKTICNSPTEAIPLNSSKCKCDEGFSLDIVVPYLANIEVVKEIIPSDDLGLFNLYVDDRVYTAKGNGDSTGKLEVGAGTSTDEGASHIIGETAYGDTDLTDYSSFILCTERDDPTSEVASSNDAGPLQLTVQKDDDIVCTITNTRSLGTLKVVKELVGTNISPSDFSFKVNGETAIRFENDGVNELTVSPGIYSVEEESPGDQYSVSYNNCTDLNISTGVTETCTITNTKLPTLTVNKILDPVNHGIFNLKINDLVKASNVGNGGTTGPQILSIGDHTVSEEAADASTSLNNYIITYGGDCDTDGNITLSAGDDKTCTITNTAYGSVRITKNINPADQTTWDFTLSSTSQNYSANNLVHNQSHLFDYLVADDYVLSEASDTKYTTNIICDGISGDIGSNQYPLTINPGDDVECIITNTRNTGRLKVRKLVDWGNLTDWSFSLNGGDAITPTLDSEGNAYVDFGQVNTEGIHTIIEYGPFGTHYLGSISGTNCTANDSKTGATATVTTGGETICTFSNLVYRGSITVTKLARPYNSSQTFSFLTTGEGLSTFTLDDNDDITFSNTESFTSLLPGSYSITETIPSGWDLSSLECTSSVVGKTVGPFIGTNMGSFILDAGENVNCVFTNTQRGKIIVEKQTLPDGHNQTFSFTGEVSGTIGDGEHIEKDVVPSTYTVSETMPFTSGYRLISIVCDDVNSTGNVPTGMATFNVEPGETVKCIFTNEIFGSITAHKFHDLDQDGEKDIEEPGLSGWEIHIYDAHGCQEADNIGSSTTGTDGNLTRFSLIPGQYSVSEVVQTGWQNITNTCQNITVNPGQNVVVNFGNIQLGSILVHKFQDMNANGIKDAEDSGSNYWQMNLFNGSSCTGNSIDTGVTGGGGVFQLGDYIFTDLLPGQYSVQEIIRDPSVPGGSSWINTTGGTCQDVYVNPGSQSNTTFGNYKGGLINACKYNDLNGNGLYNSGEPAMSGWTVYLETPTGQILSGTTASNGCYTFKNLVPGEHILYEEDRAGWTRTFPAESTRTYNISSSYAVGVQFRNFELGSISGQKFHDINGNGIKDPNEPGLPDWTISLDKNADGIAETTTTTDSDGNYVFTGLTVGTYRVREELKTGWTQTTQNPIDIQIFSGANSLNNNFGNFQNITVTACKEADMDGLYSTSNDRFPVDNWSVSLINNGSIIDTDSTTLEPGNGCHSWINLGPGTYEVSEEQRTGWTNLNPTTHNFGSAQSGQNFLYRFVNTQLGSISGIKWEDMNANGVRDVEDEGIDKWTIRLDKDGDGTIDFTTTTDPDGIYIFEDLLPGTYKIIENSPYPWNVSYPGAGVNYYEGVILSAGANLSGYDFGNYLNGSIEGYKWEDTNGDGIKDNTEGAPDSQWEIELWKEVNGIPVDQGSSVYTNPTTGAFSFGVSPGTYYLTEVLKPGWSQTYPNTEFLGPIEIESGDLSTNNNFGNFKNATVHIDKYEDTDGILGRAEDQEFWIGDPTFSFRLYQIEDSQWTLIGEEDTDSSGRATFENMLPTIGNYMICEVKKDGWEEMKSLYNQPNNLSQATDEYPVCDNITVTTSGYVGYSEFGNAKLSDIHGYKWHDINNNGYRDCADEELDNELLQPKYCNEWTEPLLSGWTINLYKWNGEEFDSEPLNTMITDDSEKHLGWYWFEDLLPGKYKICELEVLGWNQSYPINEDDNCHIVNLPDNNPNGYRETVNSTESPEPEYNFGNYVIPTQLEISKSNDTLGLGMSPGDTVTYTITVTAPDDEQEGTYLLKEVTVKDILPEGFEYILGSWTGTTTQPIYDGIPAQWYIGDMKEGDTIILTYQALISTTQEPGTYPDLAWVSSENILGESILGISSEDPTTNFVGTDVLVVIEDELEEGDVLGTTTQITLPATGANILFTLGSLISILIGFVLLLINPKKKLQTLLLATTFAIGLTTLFNPTKVLAIDTPTTDINVQIHQPQTPTNKTSFNVGYVALDLKSRPLVIQCYEEDYGIFGTYNTNSGNCVVDENIITKSGTYTFSVRAIANDGNYNMSKHITVVVDLESPDSITNYTKTQGTCSYILTFSIPSTTNISKVQIFRSSTQPFVANQSTLIDEIVVTPKQDVTYTDTPPVCLQEYFYAIRTVDNVNNTSPIVTDPIVTTVQAQSTTTTPSTQTPTTAVTVTQTGQIIGEDEELSPEEEIQQEDAEVLGEEEGEEDDEEEEKEQEDESNNTLLIITIAALVLGSVGYIYVRAKRKQTS